MSVLVDLNLFLVWFYKVCLMSVCSCVKTHKCATTELTTKSKPKLMLVGGATHTVTHSTVKQHFYVREKFM